MASFSVGEAIGSGFGVVRRSPLAVLYWAAAYIVLFLLPYYLLMRPLLPDIIGAYQGALGGAGGGDIMAMQSRMMTIQPLIWLISFISNAVLVGAIFRAVLEPASSRFGYLRFGRQELWIGLSYLALVLIAILITIAVMIPVGIVSAFTAASAGGGGAVGLLVSLLMLAACAVIVWIMLRLSMALPMSFAEQRFVLFRSWDMTRGQTGKLFLVALALVGIILMTEIVLAALGWGVFTAMGGDWRALLEEPADRLLARFAPALVGSTLVGSVIVMAVYAVMIAPWASIYRQLTADEVAV